ncbi:MAG: hypothetical protein J6P12_09690 [Methanobrevibacter sp.]|nr:hypothetical protein [Methanobrevibacter sp.]
MTAGGRSTNTCLINHEKKIKIPVKDRKYNPKIYGDHPMAKAVLQFTFDGEYLNR